MPTKILKTLPSFGDSCTLEWATIPHFPNGQECIFHSVCCRPVFILSRIAQIRSSQWLKKRKLFTWMSSDQDSFSKSRMRLGSSQRCTRSAWTITALLLQAFLQQGDTRQFLSMLWWPEPMCLHGNTTSGQATICLCGCKTTPPRVTVGAVCRPQPSSFLQAPRLGAVGKSRGAATSLYGHGQTKTVKGPKLEVSTSAFLTDSKDLAWLLGSLGCSAASRIWSNGQMP